MGENTRYTGARRALKKDECDRDTETYLGYTTGQGKLKPSRISRTPGLQFIKTGHGTLQRTPNSTFPRVSLYRIESAQPLHSRFRNKQATHFVQARVYVLRFAAKTNFFA